MLKLNDLQVRLGSNEFNYNLQADANRVSAILGKSGSGKSTLLNVIAGFLNAESGGLSWNEQSLLKLAANQRPITTLFQQHNLFSHLTVTQNVGLGINPSLKLNLNDHQNIRQVLSEVGMAGYGDKNAANLSGGEQQRTALARCLLRKQPILLLDEPFSALDESTRHEMIALTKNVITKHRLCVVLVTHNEDDADMLDAVKYQLSAGQLKRQTS